MGRARPPIIDRRGARPASGPCNIASQPCGSTTTVLDSRDRPLRSTVRDGRALGFLLRGAERTFICDFGDPSYSISIDAFSTASLLCPSTHPVGITNITCIFVFFGKSERYVRCAKTQRCSAELDSTR